MKTPLPLSAAVALASALLLSACNSEPETITNTRVDPLANAVAAAPPVELPPSVTASRSYRCKDNSLVYIDFFDNGTTANLRAKKEDAPTVLTAPAKGEPFVADGYTLTGDGATVTLAQPGKPEQSCKA